jgi:hypothetical protein
MAGEDREPREVKNHILFEIATEVAHRGMYRILAQHLQNLLLRLTAVSRWYLLRHQIQGAGNHGRIWGPLYSDRSP